MELSNNMLTLQLAQKAIAYFNRETQYPAADATIATAFSIEVNPASHLLRVALLDTLFATNLGRSRPPEGRGRKSLAEISEAIRGQLHIVEAELNKLSTRDLFALDLNRPIGASVIVECLKLIIECCNNNAISFATKYLHFTEPRLFALWDSNVRKSVRRFVPDLVIPSNGARNNYVRLLEAYKRIWLGFSEVERASLLDEDFRTQPDQWQRRNTAVRLMDKILWAMEKGHINSV